MKKVLFINPRRKIYSGSEPFDLHVPIGLLSIAAVIRKECELKIIDCPAYPNIEKTPDYMVYGMPLNKLEKEISEFTPDIIGISIPFTSQSYEAFAVAELCKEIFPKSAKSKKMIKIIDNFKKDNNLD